ncbi:MAG: alpha/beta family hydrolase [Pseudomonadota bacterium]
MSLVVSAVKVILLAFGAAGILVYLFQGRLIFYPQKLAGPVPDRFRSSELTLTVQGNLLHGWFVRKRAVSSESPLIVYYGGNAEEVSCNLDDLDRFDAGAFLFMNYRGYGASQGSPGEAALCRDAVAVLDTLLAREGILPGHVVLMGRSLGSGVACHVASLRPVGGVILVTPFDSLVAVARHYYPMFPVGLMLRHRFDSMALAPSIRVPMLALVGENDEIIPRERSMALTRHWGGQVAAVVIEGAGHNDIHLSARYWQAVNGFIHDHFPETAGRGVVPVE